MKFFHQLGLFAAAFSTASVAVPLAPPMPATTAALKAFVQAVGARDKTAYASLLTDDIRITDGTDSVIARKAWLDNMAKEFSTPLPSVTVIRIYQGAQTLVSGAVERAALIEQISYCPPGIFVAECFPAWRIETLTFDHQGKISALDRSTLYSLESKP